MESKIRTCALCGKQYKYCNHCEKGETATPWKNLFHSEACRDLFEIAAKYRDKTIILDEARKIYKTLDVSDINVSNIKSNLKSYILEIAKKDEPVTETTDEEDNKSKKYYSKKEQ